MSQILLTFTAMQRGKANRWLDDLGASFEVLYHLGLVVGEETDELSAVDLELVSKVLRAAARCGAESEWFRKEFEIVVGVPLDVLSELERRLCASERENP